MTNLVYSGGTIALSDPYVDIDAFTGLYAQPYDGFGGKYKYLSQVGLSPESIRNLRLPNAKFFWGLQFAPKRLGGHDKALLDDLSQVIRNFDGTAEFAARKIALARRAPLQSLDITWNSAQLPNPDSRVLLGTDRDAFGFGVVGDALASSKRSGKSIGFCWPPTPPLARQCVLAALHSDECMDKLKRRCGQSEGSSPLGASSCRKWAHH